MNTLIVNTFLFKDTLKACFRWRIHCSTLRLWVGYFSYFKLCSFTCVLLRMFLIDFYSLIREINMLLKEINRLLNKVKECDIPN